MSYLPASGSYWSVFIPSPPAFDKLYDDKLYM